MKALKIVIAVSFFFIASIAVANDLPFNNSTAEESKAITKVENDNALFKKLEMGLIHNLNSDVKGVVESSLYNAVNFKIAYPEFNSERVNQIVARIAKEGETHSLRYKAYLTLAYYKNPDRFGSPKALLSLLDYKYESGIFFYLQEIVRADQLTSKID
ncbi:hypothetical protein [Rhodohalobacter sulfatireducens]|uniref:HEAT repeat domain-containing protein n=1 Tax=Rhodohalobacter sulfatireducens TaxID=2911366 RepID=A0ABS9KEP5_9BACT|nr:hypothetical protein [Rhodohalobacter sulfatireducens]MCG2589315.1 hypothetical protein [Rhodohalobacter sulfatireducens]